MTEFSSPAAPRLARPGWLDGRLVLGVLLVLVSVVVGAFVVSSADRSSRVYTVTADLAAGTTLTEADLGVARVRLFGNGAHYLDATGAAPVGRVLARGVGRDELLPIDALVDRGRADPSRLVTVPVSLLHAPDGLRRGQLVDVFATYGEKGQAARTVAVLRRVPVEAVMKSGGALTGGGADLGVALRVAPEQTAALVSALQTARLDLVRVEAGASAGDVGAQPVVAGPGVAAPGGGGPGVPAQGFGGPGVAAPGPAAADRTTP